MQNQKIMTIQHILNKKTKTEQDWISIVKVYLNEYKKSGKTIKDFLVDSKLSSSTFQKKLSKYKDVAILQLTQENSKPKKMSRTQQLVNDFRSGIKQKIKDDGASINNKQMKWFKSKISKMSFKNVKIPEAGKLYLYAYDAKNKDTLPVWDKYPLILCLGSKVAKNGNLIFHGLNLHYVPPKVRQEFLELMLVYSSTKRLTNKTVLKIDWSKVKSFRYIEKMIKAYLPQQMKTPAQEVPPNEWINIIHLPLQQFVSNGSRSSSRSVWK